MPSRTQIRRRRVIALVLAALATAGIWAGLVRGGDSGGEGESGHRPSGVSAPVQALVKRMSPAERVDQVLLVGFDGTDSTSPVFAELRSRQLGGLIVSPANWVDAIQGDELLAELRAAGRRGGRIPPLIAAQQEGGEFRALGDLEPTASEFDVGKRRSTKAAEAWAQGAGAALRTAGVDLDLFPVADVTTIDSPVAARAFSDDPATTAALTGSALRGCSEARMACAPLHFPGLGSASQDTDKGPATVSEDPHTLASLDLPAFQVAFAQGAPAVVLSLAYYAAYDAVTPGALAPQIATGLLRKRLNYEGAAITDDLEAGAVRATMSVPDAAVAAIQAGADMVQIGSARDGERARSRLVHAVGDGEIPQQRLDEAAGRVLELKHRIGLLKGNL